MARPLPKHRAREYETIFIVHPESSTDTVEQVAGRVTDVIDKLNGKLLRAENWGKRRLAYPVKKQPQGVYLYLRYLGYSDLVHEIERNFRMLEPVLKYLTVKIDEDVDPAARPVNEVDISFIPMFEEEPIPERTSEVTAEADIQALGDGPAEAETAEASDEDSATAKTDAGEGTTEIPQTEAAPEADAAAAPEADAAAAPEADAAAAPEADAAAAPEADAAAAPEADAATAPEAESTEASGDAESKATPEEVAAPAEDAEQAGAEEDAEPAEAKESDETESPDKAKDESPDKAKEEK